MMLWQLSFINQRSVLQNWDVWNWNLWLRDLLSCLAFKDWTNENNNKKRGIWGYGEERFLIYVEMLKSQASLNKRLLYLFFRIISTSMGIWTLNCSCTMVSHFKATVEPQDQAKECSVFQSTITKINKCIFCSWSRVLQVEETQHLGSPCSGFLFGRCKAVLPISELAVD